MFNVTHVQADKYAQRLANHLQGIFKGKPLNVYPIPRGGVPASYLVARHYGPMYIVDDRREADIFIDDLIDSGRTKEKFGELPFYALIDKRDPSGYGLSQKDTWIVWPWEATMESSVEDNIVRLLEYIGEDPTRNGLSETPTRVAKAWKEWTSGYVLRPEDVLKCFEDGAKGVDEMVVLKDFPIYSHCEHHLAAIFGTITIAYIPNGKIVGLSKLGRLANVYAKRLQVQERLTNQVADALHTALNPVGVGVVVKARHLCMESRGLHQQGHITITSAVRGALKDKPEARAEFMEFVR